MIPVPDALNLIRAHLPPRRIETRTLSTALGYTTAEDVFSDVDIPPFDKSAMDGFAVCSSDLKSIPVELELIETVPAGKLPTKILKPGKTIKIMTGAPIPTGADAVVMKEKTEESGCSVRFLETIRKGSNICYQGEDLKKGALVIPAGTSLRAQEIGVLAMVGRDKVKVYQKPSVAILSTGDELIPINRRPRGAQIRNSNSYTLTAQLAQMGCAVTNLGIAPDEEQVLTRLIKKGLKNDMFVLSGGVSVGEYDIVEAVLTKLGVKILFNQVAIKPGKPVVFGLKDNTLVFGLPGNPVSAFVITEVFIRPAIAELVGNESIKRPIITARLMTPLTSSERTQYIPANYSVQTQEVTPVGWHGSADLVSLTRANALIILPPGLPPKKSNDAVEVMLLG